MKSNTLLFGGLALLSTALSAATFYVDPVNGSMSGDGSQANPWSTLEEVFANNLIESQKGVTYPYVGGAPLEPRNPGAPVQPGDTILLMSGDHGGVTIYGWFNADTITIEAASGETPVLTHWNLVGGMNWTLKGLTISPEPYGTPNQGTLVQFASHGWQGPASDCVIEDCHIYTVDDTSAWTATDWTSTAAHGISLGGPNMTARNNLIRNIDNGIAGSTNALVEYNEIDAFSGDGLRGMGDFGVYQYNLIQNCYDVDGNHDDGFQSWADDGGGPGSGVRYGIELRGNVIIESTDLSRPLNGGLQGIGCFDGFFEDWVIENNVILVSAWHGIAMLGATNCTIANNTIVDLVPGGATPWIEISGHKDGRPSTGNTVVNNLAQRFRLFNNTGLTDLNNLAIEISDYPTYFVDSDNKDFSLRKGSPAINSGTSVGAASEDIIGVVRPIAGAHDVGAYEYMETGSGTILRQVWSGVAGTSVADIPVGTAPTSSSEITSFEGPTNTANTYGARIAGYIYPPVDGTYTFYISGDDNCELWLSTDDTKDNASLIASVPGWTNSREWTKYSEQQSVSISLYAGVKYYIEALHKEGSGGDNVAVGWEGPGMTLDVIDGQYLSPWIPPTGSLLREVWTSIGGNSIASIPLATTPDVVDDLSTFEIPVNWGDSYGTRVSGYLLPTATGDYTFWISGDDNCELWLSSNDLPQNASLIANVPGWTNSRQWDKYAAQQSVTISLVAGNKYYIEALHKEGSGGDNMAVAWQGPGVPFGIIDSSALTSGAEEMNWASLDVGGGAAAGSAYVDNGAFHVLGSGNDIWSSSDEFHFVTHNEQLSGDGEIIAQLTSMENTHAYAKAGVMIRETLASNSKHASALLSPNGNAYFIRRTSTGSSSGSSYIGGTAPIWLRVVRTGDDFTTFTSPDLATWTQIGPVVTIPMAQNVYIGLAVSSHDDGVLCESVFENISVTH